MRIGLPKFALNLAAICLLCEAQFAAIAARGEDWPSWRGAAASGISGEKNVPTKWSATDGQAENILWKKPLPGVGHSSPIVWQDTIFITLADLDKLTRSVLAIDRQSGEVRWETVVATAPIETMHRDNSPASTTPLTDGKLLYCSFCVEGQLLVAALDFDGEIVWQCFPGTFESAHGFNTSLVALDDRLILSGLQDGPDAFVAAIDKQTGKTIWKTEREIKSRSFSVPYLTRIGERDAAIVSGASQTVAYAIDNGEVLWSLDGPATKTVSSIVADPVESLAFVSGGRDDSFYAVSLNGPAKSPADSSKLIRWRASKGIPYVNSPLLYDSILHIVSDDGVHRAYDAATGRLYGTQRVAGKVSASMVGAEGKVYITDFEGVTTVIENSAEYKVISKNAIGETIVASPAISNGDIIIRGQEHLFLIRE